MKITWFGQACFELLSTDGLCILCDPYDPSTGYAEHPRRADIVTISHEHHDHNDASWVQGSPEIIRGTGTHTIKSARIMGLPSFHDMQGGAHRGLNTVFVIETDGLRLCHMGDLGHAPSKELMQGIGRPDVLFIPVGGYYTIGAGEAAEIAKAIGARLTIPMHFNTGVRDTPVGSVDEFARVMGASLAEGCSIDISVGYAGPATVVLDYLR
jgi:L-ascorbate metabolism protein UlaG (beta-lactamase superfamily)